MATQVESTAIHLLVMAHSLGNTSLDDRCVVFTLVFYHVAFGSECTVYFTMNFLSKPYIHTEWKIRSRGQLRGRISLICVNGASPTRPSSPSLDVWSLVERSVISLHCDCYKSIEGKRALAGVDWERVRPKRGDNHTIKHAHIKSD